MSKKTIAIGLSAAICAALGFAALRWRPTHDAPRKTATAEAAKLAPLPGDLNYATQPARAKAEYKEFIAKNDANPDKGVQDQVGHARMKLAYLDTKTKDFDGARRIFKEAESKYKGHGDMGADFGGIKDGAAYQAAACLMAEHKTEEARKELRQFLQQYPLSPLVRGAYRRLQMLPGGATAADDKSLQTAVAQQQQHIQMEMAMCGPKCVVKLMELTGRQTGSKPLDYKAVAKLCGTTDKGTTMQGMRDGLRALGIQTFGFSLNRKDFARMPLPAILLSGQHYVVVTAVTPTTLTVYDPSLNRADQTSLPALDSSDFTATVLLTSIPELQTK